MRSVLFFAVVLLTSAGAAKAQQSTLDEAAAKAYDNCLRANAELLDDGKSDASTIGLAVASACAAQRRQVAVGSSRGSFELQQYMQSSLDQRAHGSATAFVLAVRKGKEATATKPSVVKPKAKPKGETI